LAANTCIAVALALSSSAKLTRNGAILASPPSINTTGHLNVDTKMENGRVFFGSFKEYQTHEQTCTHDVGDKDNDAKSVRHCTTNLDKFYKRKN
jgi:hypothetical protein